MPVGDNKWLDLQGSQWIIHLTDSFTMIQSGIKQLTIFMSDSLNHLLQFASQNWFIQGRYKYLGAFQFAYLLYALFYAIL